MKKIFYILMSAVVALGAVACDNAIDDNLTPEQQGESVSITVSIAETRVALGEVVEGKGQKVVFEEGDQLFVFAGSGKEEEGYYFTYEKAEGEDAYVFTCTADGVSAIVGTSQYVYYQGGRKGVTDDHGNPDDLTIKGAFIEGYGKIGTAPISMNVAPLLKFKSDYPVTVTASDWVFNGRNKITSTGNEECVYISTHGTYTIDITATINGKPAWVKGKNGAADKATGTVTLAMEYNKIYNLGELIPEPIKVDVANITIDGNFEDWDDVVNNVSTVPASTSYASLKTLKAYATSTDIYFYVEYDPAEVLIMHTNMDYDMDNTTGTKQAWMWSNYSDARLEVTLYSYDDAGNQTIVSNPYWSRKYWTTAWTTDSEMSVTNGGVVVLDANTHAMEYSIPRTTVVNTTAIGETIGIGVYLDTGSRGGWSIPGYLPQSGAQLVIPIPAAE